MERKKACMTCPRLSLINEHGSFRAMDNQDPRLQNTPWIYMTKPTYSDNRPENSNCEGPIEETCDVIIKIGKMGGLCITIVTDHCGQSDI